MKKILSLIIFLLLFYDVIAQADQNVTLTVTGQGKTQDEARKNALRSAIEQVFGTFISSNTEILNDNLIKEEIVSISNGNIQKYDLLNETALPDGSYSTTLKAIVSINKLTSFCESKGVTVEFKGGLFAMNMALQELYEKNEILAWGKTKLIIYEMMKKGFDYKIDVNQPIKLENNKYGIEIDIYISMNKNYTTAINILLDFCKSISLNETGAKEYVNTKKEIYPIIFPSREINFNDVKTKYQGSNKMNTLNKKIPLYSYIIRNRIVANEILLTPWKMANQAIYNFSLSNGVDEIKMDKYLRNNTIEISEDETKDRFSRYKGYVLTGDFIKYWQLFGWTIDGGGHKKKANIGNPSLNSIFNGDIFIDPNSRGYSGYQNPLQFIPIANFIGINQFLHIHFVDIRDINEIKNITEYKIQAN